MEKFYNEDHQNSGYVAPLYSVTFQWCTAHTFAHSLPIWIQTILILHRKHTFLPIPRFYSSGLPVNPNKKK